MCWQFYVCWSFSILLKYCFVTGCFGAHVEAYASYHKPLGFCLYPFEGHKPSGFCLWAPTLRGLASRRALALTGSVSWPRLWRPRASSPRLLFTQLPVRVLHARHIIHFCSALYVDQNNTFTIVLTLSPCVGL